MGRLREYVPALHVADATNGVCLTLRGITHASGPTLQDAADELVRKVPVIVMTFRSGGAAPATPAIKVDPAVHEFIWELGRVAARGGDIRDPLFAPSYPPT